MLPPALGQWVQATMAPEAQFQFLRVLGEKNKLHLQLSKEGFWMPEELCVHCSLSLCSGWLCLLEGSAVSHCPRSGEPGPFSLPHLSEDEQVTIHQQPLLCWIWQVPSVQPDLLAERINTNFCRCRTPGSTPFPQRTIQPLLLAAAALWHRQAAEGK